MVTDQQLAPAPEEIEVWGAIGVPGLFSFSYTGPEGERITSSSFARGPEKVEGRFLELAPPGCKTAFYLPTRVRQAGASLSATLVKRTPASIYGVITVGQLDPAKYDLGPADRPLSVVLSGLLEKIRDWLGF